MQTLDYLTQSGRQALTSYPSLFYSDDSQREEKKRKRKGNKNQNASSCRG